MKVFALTVLGSEMSRYWASVLQHHQGMFDGWFVFADHCTDDSDAVAGLAGCSVVQAGPDSFLDHEGRFRQAAWTAFEEAMHPEEGDWVLALDSDEALVSLDDTNARLRRVCEEAAGSGHKAVLLSIPEVFDLDGPRVRVDGLWGSILGTRLFRYESGGVYADKPMACGAEPTYVAKASYSRTTHGLVLLHYGYAHPDDVAAKHERYSKMTHGHNDTHIASIVTAPTLVQWNGPAPSMVRGALLELL